ncbi:hypothetical protein JOD49_002272 [Oerskovia jenensis]|uniref:Uncharacterized protein n=1 Tax=Oerskovia jenensis TaxID=162169 RepID=A0ABS2LG42_9CELL|nr:hypothetical protein [Oerskovia jenensis]
MKTLPQVPTTKNPPEQFTSVGDRAARHARRGGRPALVRAAHGEVIRG